LRKRIFRVAFWSCCCRSMLAQGDELTITRVADAHDPLGAATQRALRARLCARGILLVSLGQCWSREDKGGDSDTSHTFSPGLRMCYAVWALQQTWHNLPRGAHDRAHITLHGTCCRIEFRTCRTAATEVQGELHTCRRSGCDFPDEQPTESGHAIAWLRSAIDCDDEGIRERRSPWKWQRLWRFMRISRHGNDHISSRCCFSKRWFGRTGLCRTLHRWNSTPHRRAEGWMAQLGVQLPRRTSSSSNESTSSPAVLRATWVHAW
jgi:hypothetical protein